MVSCICVGLGGFVGAMCRYLCGLIPIASSFPLITLLINIVGSLLIGFITTISGQWMSPHLLLFLKTGVCGGFTTFSTFSLETFQLLGDGKPGIAVAYAAFSIILCLAGVFLGTTLGRMISH